MKTVGLLFFVFIALGSLLSGCGGGQSMILLALHEPGETGKYVQRGLAFAVEELNSRDGLRGTPLQLEIKEISEPPKTDAILKLVRQKHPSAIIVQGETLSRYCAQISSQIKVPIISLTHLAQISKDQYNWYFENAITPQEEALVLWQLIRQLAPGRVGMIKGQSGFENEIEKELLTLEEADMLKGVINPLTPKMLIPGVLANYTALVLLEPALRLPARIRSLRSLGYAGTILATSQVLHPSVRLLPDSLGIICPATAIENRLLSLTRRTSDIFQSKFGKEMSVDAALAYDTVMLVTIVFGNDQPKADNLRAALSGEFVYPSIFGTRFSPHGMHRLSPKMQAVIIRQGEAESLSFALSGVMP